MKKGVAFAVGLSVIGIALYLFFNSSNPALPTAVPPPTQTTAVGQAGTSPAAPLLSSATTGTNPAEVIAPQSRVEPPSLAATAAPVVPDSSPAAPLPPETVLENVRRAVHQYGEMFGGNPVGTNPEITSQLTGNNPKHINFIAAQAGMTVNGDGELVDEWGTPYFFHQISGAEMEVHSAGPDKVMWTSDDLVVK